MQLPNSPRHPLWTSRVLALAAAYNMLWGTAVIVAPNAIFDWAGMEPARYPGIWQCVGMIVGVYGIGYAIAASDPFRHWPIVLVGLVGKILGPVGFVVSAMRGDLPWRWGATILTNDLIWWVPFVAILYLAFRSSTDTARDTKQPDLNAAMDEIFSQRGSSLREISDAAPTLVVFLRHTGCTFCRETLAELAEHRFNLHRQGIRLAIVHMGRPMEGTLVCHKHDLYDTHLFSDPNCNLYRAFGLERGRMLQLFGPSVILRAARAFVKGHGIGQLSGDGFRMPGAFMLVNGRVVAEHRSRTAADHPNYLEMARAAGRHRANGQPTSSRGESTYDNTSGVAVGG